jgi:hypothetical protein
LFRTCGQVQPRLTRARLAHHALAVLEAARERGLDQPTPLTPADRLAIGWLLWDGIAERWQADKWAAALTRPGHGGMADYCRERDLTIYLNAWRRVEGDRS